MAKKTVPVRVLFDHYSTALAKTVERDEYQACSALSFVIETLLMEADAYAGFEYVNRDNTRVSTWEVQTGEYVSYWRRYFPPKV